MDVRRTPIDFGEVGDKIIFLNVAALNPLVYIGPNILLTYSSTKFLVLIQLCSNSQVGNNNILFK